MPKTKPKETGRAGRSGRRAPRSDAAGRPSRSSCSQIWAALGIPADYARRRHMRVLREATRLVFVCRAADDGKMVRLAPAAAAAWWRMQAAAASDGVELLALSGFRSVRRQTAIVRAKLAGGKTIAEILRFVAAPGCSEHHTGRALDIGSPEELELDGKFERTAAFRWLRRRAGEFGFHLSYPRGNRHGFGYEPWHWCWRR